MAGRGKFRGNGVTGLNKFRPLQSCNSDRNKASCANAAQTQDGYEEVLRRITRRAKALDFPPSASQPTGPILMRAIANYRVTGSAVGYLTSEYGEFAYIPTNGDGLIILNITDPLNPVLISQTDYTSYKIEMFSNIALSNHPNLLAIVNGNAGITIVNVTNTSRPTLVGALEIPGQSFALMQFVQNPNLLAVGSGNAGVMLVNITNVSNPVLVSTLTMTVDFSYIMKVAQYPNLLFIAASSNGIKLVDVTNISHPVLVSSLLMPGSVIWIMSPTQYPNLLVTTNGDAGVYIVNITDISNISIISSIKTVSYAYSIAELIGHPNLLIVGDGFGGITLIDIANIFSPVLTSNLRTVNEWIWGARLLARHPNLLISSSTIGVGIEEINYTPVLQCNYLESKMTINMSYTVLSVAQLELYPNLLALANQEAGIALVNVTDISHPVLVSTLATGGNVTSITGLLRYPHLLAVMDSAVGIMLVNITNIFNPTLVTTLQINYAHSVITLGSYFDLVVFSDDGIVIIDVTNAGSLTQVFTLPLQALLSGTLIPNYPNIVVVSARNVGLIIVDITNIASPVTVSSLPRSNMGNSVITLPNYPNLVAAIDEDAGVILIDITSLYYPILVTSILTPGTPSSVMVDPQNPNSLLVADGNAGISIIEINPLAVWTSYLPVQKVGQLIFEQMLIYKFNPAELLQTNKLTFTVQQIATDGQGRIDPPYWLSVERETLILNGVPPKEVTGQHFVIEVAFNATSVITRETDAYKALFRFDIVSSLNLNQTLGQYTLLNGASFTLPTLLIDSLSQLVTLVLTASTATNIRFLSADDFGPIRPSYSPNTGVFQAFGAVVDLNTMLERLRYSPLVSDASMTTISVQLSDNNLNYPTHNTVNMSFFRQNYPPACLHNVIEIAFEIKSTLDYTIPLGQCIDVDDSITGATLAYNAYSIANTSLVNQSSALPAWLTFITDQRRFSGNVPYIPGSIFIRVDASDRYATDFLIYKFIFEHTVNQPPVLNRPIQKLTVTTCSSIFTACTPQLTSFIPTDYFTDPDGADLTITFLNTPTWLQISPSTLTLNANNLTQESVFSLASTPKPTDTNPFSDYDGSMSIIVYDQLNQTLVVQFPYAVGGASVASLMVSYGSTVIGILGPIIGYYAYRNKIYNLFAWNRYRHRPEQFGKQVDELQLFAVKSVLTSDDESTSFITGWSAKMPSQRDYLGSHYFKHKVLSRFTDAQITEKHKDITETTICFVRPLPERTVLEKVKAKVSNAIRVVFDVSFGNLFGRFGIKMNPSFLTLSESIVAGFPAWLDYDQTTRVLRVVDVAHNVRTLFDTPIVLRFLNDDGRIMEEMTIIVRDESSFESIFPNVASLDANSPRADEHQVLTVARRGSRRMDSYMMGSEMGPTPLPNVPASDPSEAGTPSFPLFGKRSQVLPTPAAPKPEESAIEERSRHALPILSSAALPSTSTALPGADRVLSPSMLDQSSQVLQTPKSPQLEVSESRRCLVSDERSRAASVMRSTAPLPDVPALLPSLEGTVTSPRLHKRHQPRPALPSTRPPDELDDTHAHGPSLLMPCESSALCRRYSVDGMHKLLSIRLAGHDVVIHPAIVVRDGGTRLSIPSATSTPAILPMVHHGHWVGVVFDSIKTAFIDSKNNPPPEAISNQFATDITQTAVPQQLQPTTCGSEFVEDVALIVTGQRVTENAAPYFHRNLMGKLEQLEAILAKYSISMSISEALTRRGLRKLSLYTHPDKDGDLEDFLFVQSLRTSTEQQTDVIHIPPLETWRSTLHKANLVIKATDLGINVIKLYQDPTLDTAKGVGISTLHLYSAHSGVTSVSVAAGAVSIGYTYYHAPDHLTGLYYATIQATMLACFMALPTMLAIASPKLAIGYGVSMTVLGAYQVASGIYDLLPSYDYTGNQVSHSNNPSFSQLEDHVMATSGDTPEAREAL